MLEQRGAAGDFVLSLDLTDLYNITMNYQDRVQFQLGSTVELAYKVDYGLRPGDGHGEPGVHRQSTKPAPWT